MSDETAESERHEPSAEQPGRTASTLRNYTPARVQLCVTGVSLTARDHLDFQLAHAQARDAVHAQMAVHSLIRELGALGLPVLAMKSAAPDRATYLRRPDLGRTLNEASLALLKPSACDVAFVVADGLSAVAVERHALPLLKEVLPLLEGWKLGPLCVVEQGRVAVGDAIGAAFEACLVVVLIGERPGLSSPDSLGIYVTWEPRVGRTDAERNCISNVREEGLNYAEAARRLAYYLNEARRRKLTGVALKDASSALEPGTKGLAGA